MAKNKHFINSMKTMYNQRSFLVEGTYAAIGIAMYQMGYEQDEIADVFALSQQIWDNHEGNVTGMIQKCEDETGIAMKGTTKEKADEDK